MEARGDTAVFAWGRFNPPTTGHGKLIDATGKQQKNNAGSKMYIFSSHSQDPKKNPLPHSKKIAYMRKMFPKYAKSIIANKQKTLFQIAVFLHDEGHRAIVMVAGSDRVAEFEKLLNEYNGVESRHGYYGFDNIEVVSAGERDPDAEGIEGMSASKMRAAAVDGDFDSFEMGLPSTFKDGKKLYQDVRKNMGIREERDMGDMNDYEVRRDAYLTGKIWNAGDIVEVNGVSGEVVRKGTNYLSFVDEDGKVHKAWLHEITLTEESSVYKKTATKAKNKEGTIYAFGRDKKLDGQPKEKGGYSVWKLEKRYAGHVKGGIAQNWAYVKKDLSYSDAVKLMNKRLKYKGFNEEDELDEEKVPNDDLNWIKTGGMVGEKRRFPTYIVKKEGNKYKAYDEQNKMNLQAGSNSLEGLAKMLKPYIEKRTGSWKFEEVDIDEGKFTDAAKKKIEKEKDSDKTKHDTMLSRAKSKDSKGPQVTPWAIKRVVVTAGEEFELEEVWTKEIAAKISQVTHPRGWKEMVQQFVKGMKDPEHKKHPSAWAADVAAPVKGVDGRQLIKYINKLVDKGVLPKELKANYTNEKFSFKEFVQQIEDNNFKERKLTGQELKDREKYAKKLPDDEFKKRYGDRWKEVKIATATNMAKEKS